MTSQLKVFQGEQHADFLIECGQSAALLIHGFPGTPAEMRPLASLLNSAGWTTRGLLLPGFGAQIESLFQRRAHEWIEAAVDALRSLQAAHDPVVVIGYSMGAAIAIHAAARLKPDRLILLAPFWQLGGLDLDRNVRIEERGFRRAFVLNRKDADQPQVNRQRSAIVVSSTRGKRNARRKEHPPAHPLYEHVR